MAGAPIIGRTTCGFCGASATVRRTDGKHPYAYCGECGGTAHARNGVQAAGLLARMTPIGEPKPAAEAQTGALQGGSVVEPPAVTRRIEASAPSAPTRPRSTWSTLLDAAR